jgi:hypothetical protein
LVHKEPDRWKAYLRTMTCFLGTSKNIDIEYEYSLQENMATRTLSNDIYYILKAQYGGYVFETPG